MNTENKRLEDLNSYKILDTSPEEELDELAEIAALICDTPIALITLIDKERQWFKANKGLGVPETPREDSFCQHALHKPKEILVVNDSLEDDRFKKSPLVVGQPNIRFYAGAPLETPDGNVLGTLCVIDDKPKTISKNQEEALRKLSKKAMDYLNIRKIIQNQENKIEFDAERLKRLTDNVPLAIFQLVMNPDGNMKFEFLSEGIQRLYPNIDLDKTEWEKDPALRLSLIHPEDRQSFIESRQESYENLSQWRKEFRLNSKNNEWHLIKARPQKLENGNVVWYGTVQNITQRKDYEMTLEQISFDISHVLRKPVANLLGLTSLMTTAEDLNDIDFKEYLKHIQTVANELEKFTIELNNVYQKKKETITNPDKKR